MQQLNNQRVKPSLRSPHFLWLPSKHAGSDSHLIRISLKVLARSGLDDSSTPACFRTGSLQPKPDSQPEPNQIRSGVAQYDLGRLWKNATESESGKLVVRRMHSARSRPNDSCTAACFWTRSVWPKPEEAIQIGSGPVLHNMIWAYFRRVKPNCMRSIRHICNPAEVWLHAGHNGHNWP